ncbi:MAG: hypothetical protein ACRDZ8_11005 [Acidimicrobiales bacterium]
MSVTLVSDVNQVDDTGNVWAFLSDAAEPGRIQPGALIVAGDAVEPFLAASSTSSTDRTATGSGMITSRVQRTTPALHVTRRDAGGPGHWYGAAVRGTQPNRPMKPMPRRLAQS